MISGYDHTRPAREGDVVYTNFRGQKRFFGVLRIDWHNPRGRVYVLWDGSTERIALGPEIRHANGDRVRS